MDTKGLFGLHIYHGVKGHGAYGQDLFCYSALLW